MRLRVYEHPDGAGQHHPAAVADLWSAPVDTATAVLTYPTPSGLIDFFTGARDEEQERHERS